MSSSSRARILLRLLNPSFLRQLRNYSYEGDGKTNVTILNNELDSPIMVDSYSKSGFTLNNGLSVVGPVALFPKTALSWDINSSNDVTAEALSAFLVLEPIIDILVIGVGDYGNSIPKETKEHLRKKGIKVEILPTEHACTTFNYLNVERRNVAAALIPPRTSKLIDIEAYRTKLKNKTDIF